MDMTLSPCGGLSPAHRENRQLRGGNAQTLIPGIFAQSVPDLEAWKCAGARQSASGFFLGDVFIFGYGPLGAMLPWSDRAR